MFAPNSIIENLLQRHKAQAAMTLDALFAADIHNWPMLDISTILAYLQRSGIGIGESIVRRGLFDLSQLGLLVTRKIMTRQKGRPSWAYRIQSLEKMAANLGVKIHRDENRDAIPFTAFKSARAFRGALHYAFIARMGISHLSRKKLGARLGVGGRSTFNYEQGTNIHAEQRVERTPLTMADVESAPIKRLNQNVFLEVEFERDMTDDELRTVYKDFDESYLLIGNRKTTDKKYMPYTQFILRRELERGNRVFRLKQITNEYTIAA